MQLQAAHHLGIMTTDLARLEAFYADTLGLPVAMRWDDVGIVFLEAGGLLLELIQQPATVPAAGEHASSQNPEVQQDGPAAWVQGSSPQGEATLAPAAGTLREIDQPADAAGTLPEIDQPANRDLH